MGVNVIRACRDCGAPIALGSDRWYCEDCVKKRKSKTTREMVCPDCGVTFIGYPRSKRCPACAKIRSKEIDKKRKKSGTERPLGSTDKCQVCGKDYVVTSGRQKYCPDCARQAVLDLQKTYKVEYNRASGMYEERQRIRDEQERICAYCGIKYHSKSPSNTCSEYCRKKHNKLMLYKRTHKDDVQKLIEEMEEYRKKILSNP